MYKGGGGLTQGADKPIRKDQHLHKSSSAFSACVSMVRVGQQVAEVIAYCRNGEQMDSQCHP